MTNDLHLGGLYLLMAVMLIVTKALALLIIVPLLCWVNRPGRYVAGLLTIGIPGLILLYALTGNYKNDQVHMKQIIERLGQ